MENVAVIGASPREDRYSNKAMRLLAEYGHNPIPVAPGYRKQGSRPTIAEGRDQRGGSLHPGSVKNRAVLGSRNLIRR